MLIREAHFHWIMGLTATKIKIYSNLEVFTEIILTLFSELFELFHVKTLKFVMNFF